MKTVITAENFPEKAKEYLEKLGVKIMPDWLGSGTVCQADWGICENCIFHGACGSQYFTDEHISRLQKHYDEQEKDMDMTLKEAQTIYKRMCNDYNGTQQCSDCLIKDTDCGLHNIDEQILRDWAASHPVKTNLDCEKEKIKDMTAEEYAQAIDHLLVYHAKHVGMDFMQRKPLIAWLNSEVE